MTDKQLVPSLSTDPSSSPEDKPSGGVGLLQLDFDPKFNSLRSTPPIALEWNKLSYSVNVGSKKERQLVKGICGVANPSTVTAVLGPSGSSKTTTLNILAGRISGKKSGRKLSGEIKVNGVVTTPAGLRSRVAFVTQEDALFPTSTTLEALQFSARLRLPSTVTAEERNNLVEDIIESLGLGKVRNSLVGSELIRGLSGGEKKRVAIGVEIVSSPSVLFLDEPTSGLDSFSAWKVVRILNALAGRLPGSQSKCTVLCSIHQPSSEVFREFSHLILLADGHVIFQGVLKDINPVFRSKGLGAPPDTNLADHIMLQAQTQPFSALPLDDENTRAPEPVQIISSTDGNIDPSGRSKSRVGSFMFRPTDPSMAQAGFGTQALLLAQRELRGLVRDKVGLIGRFGGTAFLNVLFAVIFSNAGDQTKSTYTAQTHFGAITQIFIGALFGASQPSLLAFPLEKITFLRERASNTYFTTPYLISKLLVELPLNFLTALLTLLVSYWTIGLGGNFFYLTMAIFLLMEAAISSALLIGTIASNAKAALELAPVMLVPQILFLGFFIQINQLPEWLQWVRWVVATKFGIDLALVTEFGIGRCITKIQCDAAGNCGPHNICNDWENILAFNDVKADDAYIYVLVLVGLFAGFRLLALFLLARRATQFEN